MSCQPHLNANHSIGCAAEVHRIPDCVLHRIRFAIPQPPEWQHIADQINAAMVFAWADFVNVMGAVGLIDGLDGLM